MKKRILIVVLFFLGIHSIYAFFLDKDKFSFSERGTEIDLLNAIDKRYRLSYQMKNQNSDVAEKIAEVSKNITYFLLRRENSKEESALDYYQRYQKYLTFRYAPDIPKLANGYDTNSQEYKDELVSSFYVPNMFRYLDELGIEYSTISSIMIFSSGDTYMASVFLPGVKMKQVNPKNKREYQTITTDLTMYYVFKEYHGEYKLYYLKGETTDSLSLYFHELENKEKSKIKTIMSPYKEDFKNVYNYHNLDSITNIQKEEIIKRNENSVVMLNSYYNNNLLASAHGFFLKKGILVTSWSYFEKSLNEAQYIIIKDGNGNFYDLDGIVTLDVQSDIVILKLKQELGSPVTLSNKNLTLEDAIFTLSSKSGIGLVLQSGIHLSKTGQDHNLLPLLECDAGSPLFNHYGEVVGMNTDISTNTSISTSIPVDILKEAFEKLDGVSFADIPSISFQTLKEKYYYRNYQDEVIKNDISENIWKKYSKIGDIENTISLQLMKASYHNGILSLRYQNDTPDYMQNLQLSNAFRKELESSGYELVSKSDDRYVYQNDEYKIIIMSQFYYLIIVMVSL